MSRPKPPMINVNEFSDRKKATWFANAIFYEGLGLVCSRIRDGHKTIDELSSPVTCRDVALGRPCCNMQIRHKQITEKLIESFEKNQWVIEHKNDITYPFLPIIQSNGVYNLNLNETSDNNYFRDDVIIVCVGIKYKNICSTIIRTIVFTPDENTGVKETYQFLFKVQKNIINNLKHGAELGKVYQSAVDFVKIHRPELLSNLTVNFGSRIGSEPEYEDYMIEENSKAIAEEKMLFNVKVGFKDLVGVELTGKADSTYALWIGDDVQVERETPATTLNPIEEKLDKSINELIFYQDRKLH